MKSLYKESKQDRARGDKLISGVSWILLSLVLFMIVPRACAQDTTVVVNLDGNKYRIQRIAVPEDTVTDVIVLNTSVKMTRAKINAALIARFMSTRGPLRYRSIGDAYEAFNGRSIYSDLGSDYFPGKWLLKRNTKSRFVTLESGGSITGGGSWAVRGQDFKLKLPGRKPMYLRIQSSRRMVRGPIKFTRAERGRKKR